MKNIFKLTSLLMITTLLSTSFIMNPKAAVVKKQYSVLIADKNGVYTYYDLKEENGEAGIEITDQGKIMIPLQRIIKLLDSFEVSYNKKSKQATVTNLDNKKKLVFAKDSINCTYYFKSGAKGIVKKMPYKMYISNTNAEIMVHISALKWIMDNSKGVKSFGTKEMMRAGYDTFSYSGLIVFDPFTSIEMIPKATGVKNLSQIVKVTIPEGFSLPQIFTLLIQKGVCASEEFLYDAMKEFDFSTYSMVNEINRENNKCYYLEGYLYPDTYEFYRLSNSPGVISKLIKNAQLKTTSQYQERAAQLSLTWEEVLIIASLIEKEAGKKKWMADVSSVIHNRLRKGMKLQLDATIYYVERYIKPNLSEDIDRFNSDYNTYKCPALPAGPICNPGKEAIEAALYPATTDYLFFYSDENGEYHFSKNLVTKSP